MRNIYSVDLNSLLLLDLELKTDVVDGLGAFSLSVEKDPRLRVVELLLVFLFYLFPSNFCFTVTNPLLFFN